MRRRPPLRVVRRLAAAPITRCQCQAAGGAAPIWPTSAAASAEVSVGRRRAGAARAPRARTSLRARAGARAGGVDSRSSPFLGPRSRPAAGRWTGSRVGASAVPQGGAGPGVGFSGSGLGYTQRHMVWLTIWFTVILKIPAVYLAYVDLVVGEGPAPAGQPEAPERASEEAGSSRRAAAGPRAPIPGRRARPARLARPRAAAASPSSSPAPGGRGERVRAGSGRRVTATQLVADFLATFAIFAGPRLARVLPGPARHRGGLHRALRRRAGRPRPLPRPGHRRRHDRLLVRRDGDRDRPRAAHLLGAAPDRSP